ncbi:MAG: hypothetical protein AAGF11_04785 [Myxococcota bacterium]
MMTEAMTCAGSGVNDRRPREAIHRLAQTVDERALLYLRRLLQKATAASSCSCEDAVVEHQKAAPSISRRACTH